MTSPPGSAVASTGFTSLVWDLDRLTPATGSIPEAVDLTRQATATWEAQPTTPATLRAWIDVLDGVHSTLAGVANFLTLRASDGPLTEAEDGIEDQLRRAVEDADHATKPVRNHLAGLGEAQFAELLSDPALSRYRPWLALQYHQAARAPDRPSAREGEPNPGTNPAGDAASDAGSVASHQDQLDETRAGLLVTTASFTGHPDEALQVGLDLSAKDGCVLSEATYAAMHPHTEAYAAHLNHVIAHRVSTATPHALWTQRAATDEVDPDVLNAVIDTVARHPQGAQQWWARRPRGLAIRISLDNALAVIEQALDTISPALADVLRSMLDAGTVQAAPDRPGGAFCLLPTPQHPPYVTLAYTGHPRDLIRLSHEVGHALHYACAARARPALLLESPPLMSELAAFITEALVVRHAINPTSRLLSPQHTAAIKVAVIDNAIDSTHRQAAIILWERAVYELAAAGHTLDASTFCRVWRSASAYLGPRLESGSAHELDWMRIPHITHEAFYNATYPPAYLLAQAALANGAPQGTVLTEFLECGSARTVPDQLAILGITMNSWATRSSLVHRPTSSIGQGTVENWCARTAGGRDE